MGAVPILHYLKSPLGWKSGETFKLIPSTNRPKGATGVVTRGLRLRRALTRAGAFSPLPLAPGRVVS